MLLGLYESAMHAVKARAKFKNIFERHGSGTLLIDDIPPDWVHKLEEDQCAKPGVLQQALARTKKVQAFWKIITDMTLMYESTIEDDYTKLQEPKLHEFLLHCGNRVFKKIQEEENEATEGCKATATTVDVDMNVEEVKGIIADALQIISGRLASDCLMCEEHSWHPWMPVDVRYKQRSDTSTVNGMKANAFWDVFCGLVQSSCPLRGETRDLTITQFAKEGFDLFKSYGILPMSAYPATTFLEVRENRTDLARFRSNVVSGVPRSLTAWCDIRVSPHPVPVVSESMPELYPHPVPVVSESMPELYLSDPGQTDQSSDTDDRPVAVETGKRKILHAMGADKRSKYDIEHPQ